MFTESTPWYDAVYSFKDYAAEAATLRKFIGRFKTSPGNRLLDVACGTGAHLPFLRDDFEIEGVDLNPEMLSAARARCPGLAFHEQDMTELAVPGSLRGSGDSGDPGNSGFDVVLCLFSSIGYVKTEERLGATLAGFARHLRPGGIALVEPWLSPGEYRAGHIHMHTVDEPELKICRMSEAAAEVEANVSVMDMHYLIAMPNRVRHFTERHELAMFSVEQFAAAGAAAGLGHEFLDAETAGLTGRGLHVFTK